MQFDISGVTLIRSDEYRCSRYIITILSANFLACTCRLNCRIVQFNITGFHKDTRLTFDSRSFYIHHNITTSIDTTVTTIS